MRAAELAAQGRRLDLGDVDDLADRMLAALPTVHPLDQPLGPVLRHGRSRGLARHLAPGAVRPGPAWHGARLPHRGRPPRLSLAAVRSQRRGPSRGPGRRGGVQPQGSGRVVDRRLAHDAVRRSSTGTARSTTSSSTGRHRRRWRGWRRRPSPTRRSGPHDVARAHRAGTAAGVAGRLPGIPASTPTPTCSAPTARELGPWWFGNDGGGPVRPAPRRAAPATSPSTRSAPCASGWARCWAPRRRCPRACWRRPWCRGCGCPRPREVADVQDGGAAAFGVTRELESMVPYAVPQAWARAFDEAGCGGVRYGPRFTPGDVAARWRCSATRAPRDWPVDPDPVPAQQVPGAPTALPTPRRADLTVVRPPRTRVPRD